MALWSFGGVARVVWLMLIVTSSISWVLGDLNFLGVPTDKFIWELASVLGVSGMEKGEILAEAGELKFI